MAHIRRFPPISADVPMPGIWQLTPARPMVKHEFNSAARLFNKWGSRRNSEAEAVAYAASWGMHLTRVDAA